MISAGNKAKRLSSVNHTTKTIHHHHHHQEIEIENLVKGKIPKFNLQLYAFVSDNLIQFPVSDLSFDTIITNNFFRNVHRLLNKGNLQGNLWLCPRFLQLASKRK